MTRLAVLAWLGGLAFLALFGALLFGCAGRWDLPWFWAYLGVWAVAMAVATPLVDPGLIRERIRPGPGGQDSAIAYAVIPLWLESSSVGSLRRARIFSANHAAVRIAAGIP